MRPRLAAAGIAVAGAAAMATNMGYGPVASSHLFAPSLPISCMAPDHVVVSWVRDSQLPSVTKGSPMPANAREWLGWTEMAGCGESLTIRTGAR